MDLITGQYVPGETLIHRLDPRTKILGVLIYLSGLFAVQTGAGYLGMAVFAAFLLGLAGISGYYLVQGLRPLVVLIVFIFVFHLLFTPGQVLWQSGPLAVTSEGLHQGVFLSLRLVLLLLVTLLLTLTTPPLALTDGLAQLMAPAARLGIPVHDLAVMAGIALRFIPFLLEETEKIIKAQIARGSAWGTGGPVTQMRALLPVLVPVFVSAFRRADELSLAMEARCYRPQQQRTRMREQHMVVRDWLALAVVSVFAVTAACLGRL